MCKISAHVVYSYTIWEAVIKLQATRNALRTSISKD